MHQRARSSMSDSGPPLCRVRRRLSPLVVCNSNGVGFHDTSIGGVIRPALPAGRRNGVLHIPDDALLAVVPVVYREAVHVDLFLRLAPQLDRVRLRALLAELPIESA